MSTVEIRVSEIMRTDFETVAQDATIDLIIEKFSRRGCHDLIVVDRDGKYVGVITALDLLGSVNPIMGVRSRQRVPCIECLVGRGASSAENIMARRHITIGKDASVVDTMHAMEKNRQSDLVVIDAQGVAIGRVEVCDIISHLRVVGHL